MRTVIPTGGCNVFEEILNSEVQELIKFMHDYLRLITLIYGCNLLVTY
jgi:hypothetical protein